MRLQFPTGRINSFGSLFSGIGGIDLGLERSGWTCRFQVEIDPFCGRVLRKHWPQVKQHGDITKLSGADLGYVDLLAGGFPCQDLSYAGKQAGIEGSRSGLWFEYARLIGELRPRYVLIENVPGLLVHDAMRRVVGELARLGYVGIWRCFRASEFGASHLRKRVFLIAILADSERNRWREGRPESAWSKGRSDAAVSRRTVGHSDNEGLEGWSLRGCGRAGERTAWQTGGAVAHTNGRGRSLSGEGELHNGSDASGYDASRCDPHVAHTNGGQREQRRRPVQAAGHAERRVSGSDGSGQSVDDSAGARWHGRPAYSGEATAGQSDEQGRLLQPEHGCDSLADTGSGLVPQQRRGPEGRDGPGPAGADALENAAWSEQHEGFRGRIERLRRGVCEAGEPLGAFAPGPSDARWPEILRARPDLAPALESPLRGVADELSDWLDRAMQDRTKRLSRLGNAVVPAIAEHIGRLLLEFDRSTT